MDAMDAIDASSCDSHCMYHILWFALRVIACYHDFTLTLYVISRHSLHLTEVELYIIHYHHPFFFCIFSLLKCFCTPINNSSYSWYHSSMGEGGWGWGVVSVTLLFCKPKRKSWRGKQPKIAQQSHLRLLHKCQPITTDPKFKLWKMLKDDDFLTQRHTGHDQLQLVSLPYWFK